MTTTIELLDETSLWYLKNQQNLHGDRAVAVSGSAVEEVYDWVQENRICCGVIRYSGMRRPCEFAVLTFPRSDIDPKVVQAVNDGFLLFKMTYQGRTGFDAQGLNKWEPCVLEVLPVEDE